MAFSYTTGIPGIASFAHLSIPNEADDGPVRQQSGSAIDAMDLDRSDVDQADCAMASGSDGDYEDPGESNNYSITKSAAPKRNANDTAFCISCSATP